jgi:hypothetical protein
MEHLRKREIFNSFIDNFDLVSYPDISEFLIGDRKIIATILYKRLVNLG